MPERKCVFTEMCSRCKLLSERDGLVRQRERFQAAYQVAMMGNDPRVGGFKEQIDMLDKQIEGFWGQQRQLRLARRKKRA